MSRPRGELWMAEIAFLVAVGLTSCGGGGGGSTPSTSTGTTTPPPTTTTPPPATAQYALNTTAPTSNYGAGTLQEDAFNQLNAVRGAAWGYITQNAALDQAAQAHAQYLANVMSAGGSNSLHSEDPGKPGYTGATPGQRAAAAGYSGTVSEVVGGVSGSTLGREYTLGMLAMIYHGQALQAGMREVGIGVVKDPNFNQYFIVMVQGTRTWAQLPTSEAKVYPLDGQQGLNPRSWLEYEVPRPVPEVANAGHTVLFGVDNVAELSTTASQIIVNAFEMKDAGGNVVPTLLVTAPGVQVVAALASAQRQDSLVSAKNVYLVPKAPLATNATYTVTASVTTPVTTYAKSWTFTTSVVR